MNEGSRSPERTAIASSVHSVSISAGNIEARPEPERGGERGGLAREAATLLSRFSYLFQKSLIKVKVKY